MCRALVRITFDSEALMESQVTDWGTTMMASLTGAFAMFFSAIPKILGFVIILIAGWLIASLIEKAIAAVLRAIKFNDLSARSGFADFVSKMGAGTDSSGLIAAIAKWFVRLIALVVAFDALGLPAVSDVLRQLLLWLPNLVVAFGLVALETAGEIVRNWFRKGQEASDKFERAGEVAGDMARRDASQTMAATQPATAPASSTPAPSPSTRPLS